MSFINAWNVAGTFKWHHEKLKKILMRLEGGLLNVMWTHQHLVIA
jgi:hypothetical protein